jgi:hypothetical protein
MISAKMPKSAIFDKKRLFTGESNIAIGLFGFGRLMRTAPDRIA